MKMKKCLAIILALVMALGCMSFTAFAADLEGFAGGTGTESDPYQIATLTQFENFASIVNGGNNCAGIYFVLTADIGTTDTPVTTMIGSFSGHFDGQNHTVTMDIHGTELFNGLFGECIYATIANVNTAGSVSGTSATGGLCGFANGGTFNNCHNFATVSCGNDSSGGVCGILFSTMTNCSNSGDVTIECESDSKYYGGVCGKNLGTMANCYNSGTVSVTGTEAIYPTIGGVCGYNDSVMVNCYNSGVVSHTKEPDAVVVGGVCGECYSDGTITNCYYDNENRSAESAVGTDDGVIALTTGLTTEQIKGAANDETSLAYKLNSYTDEGGSYPEGWFTWIIDETTGLPMLAIPEEPEEDPSGVDLSMLTTGAKIRFGTQDESPVEWVIGGDGETGMSVPTGCIALVTSDLVAGGVMFDPNGTSYAYATSNLRTVVEGAVTFTDDEQAAIQERTLAGNQTYGEDCDGVAGESVTAKVWAPTTKDAYELMEAELSAVGSDYWLCSPGFHENEAAFVDGDGGVYKNGASVTYDYGVRAGLYLDLSKVYGATAVEGETDIYTLNLTAPSTFLTTFTLNKDYNDKYSTDAKTTAVSETVTYTITPISTGDDVPEFTSSTFTIDVTDGVGEAEVDLPDLTDVSKVGEYWYKIEETAGTTAGVDYDDTTYYLHLIVSYKDGEFGFSSAAIRSSNEVTADENGEYPTTGKIDTVSNSYGEGTLTVAQETTVNGEDSDEDAFEVTVTFTAPTGTTVIGDITYGDDQTVTFNENGVGTVVIDLKGGESVIFEHIPDGVTYTVEQTGKNEDKGYTLDEVAFDVTDETGDSVSDANVASGTIGDTADTVTFTNSKTVPIDVGVILENGAFIVLALGALIAAAWLIVSKRRKSVDAE